MADVLLEPEDQEIWASHLNRHMDAFGRDQMLMMVGNMRARLESAERERDALRDALKHLYHGVFVMDLDALSPEQYRELEEQSRTAIESGGAA